MTSEEFVKAVEGLNHGAKGQAAMAIDWAKLFAIVQALIQILGPIFLKT